MDLLIFFFFSIFNPDRINYRLDLGENYCKETAEYILAMHHKQLEARIINGERGITYDIVSTRTKILIIDDP